MKLLLLLFTLFIGVFASDTSTTSNEDMLAKEGIWIDWNIKMEGLPEHAVIGGEDENGDLVVIRAEHEDHGLIVGKFSPKAKIATVPYNNEEHFKKNFQILTHTNFAWINASDRRAVIPGVEKRMFICRAKISGFTIPGKLNRGRCFVSYDGYEYEFSDWETLKNLSWDFQWKTQSF